MKRQTDRQIFLTTLASQSRVYDLELTSDVTKRMGDYYELLQHWNDRLHLVAPCSPSEFATRHVLESLYLIRCLPDNTLVADVGSGGGLPIIPCLIARRGLSATLIESSKRKAVFLREALKVTGIEQSKVLAERFEDVTELKADFVTCRALDRFESMLELLVQWAPPASTLLLYGGDALRRKLGELSLPFREDLLPGSDRRFLFVVLPR
jgi:16S rRNA (guanine527-N7)-methyltransferase